MTRRITTPTNEAETILLFADLSQILGWHLVYCGSGFPDAIIQNPQGAQLRVEFEFLSRNFILHGHDSQDCDLIICWYNNWKKAPVPIWDLQDTLIRLNLTEKRIPIFRTRGRSKNKIAPIVIRLNLSLYPGEDDDLIEFFTSIPKRKRVAAAKAAWRNGNITVRQFDDLPDEDSL